MEARKKNSLFDRLEQEKVSQRQERLKKAQPLTRINPADIIAERAYQRTLAISKIARGTYSVSK